MAKHQAPRHQPAHSDPEQDQVEDMSAELRRLWRIMAAALARDSAGQMHSDRQSKGAREGSAATVNVDVVDAAVLVETGVSKLLAEVIPLLGLDRSVHRTVDGVLSLMPDWRRSLTARNLPLAKYMLRDLRSWDRAVRQAIGLRRHDEHVGLRCPDHRAEKSTELRLEGAQAVIAPTLLDGPPELWLLLAGPVCRCIERVDEITSSQPTSRSGRRRHRRRQHTRHASCEWIAERRLVDAATGQLSDWIVGAERELAWSSLDGIEALAWPTASTVLCPHCKRTWSTTNERRMLAAELRALGDKRSASMEAIVR